MFGGIDLQSTRTRDGIGVLPIPTPEVEAAFPERFQRDAEGRLVSIDQRPINLRTERGETLSSNLAFSIPSGTGGAPGAIRVFLNHSWRLRSTTTIRDGLPEMDRLSGDGGGLSRHELSLRLDGRKGPWGANASARWSGPYRVRRAIGVDGPDDLKVAAFGAVDLKLTYQMRPRGSARSSDAADAPRTRRSGGAQFGLEILNLFDARPRAALADGKPAPG